MGLALLLAASCFSAVYGAHWRRVLYADMQTLQQDKDRIDQEWGRLLIEEATLGNPALVEQAARKRLGMLGPGDADVLVLAR